MVPTRSLSSKSTSPCTNPLVTVPNPLIPVGITVIFIFHSFSSCLERFLFFFSLLLSLYAGQVFFYTSSDWESFAVAQVTLSLFWF